MLEVDGHLADAGVADLEALVPDQVAVIAASTVFIPALQGAASYAWFIGCGLGLLTYVVAKRIKPWASRVFPDDGQVPAGETVSA